MAHSIWRSFTRIISSTSSATIGRLKTPGVLTAIPSARVSPPDCGDKPARERLMDGYSALSTPIILISGLSDLAAILIPEISPPPPIGTIR